jgi:hypothetical protein
MFNTKQPQLFAPFYRKSLVASAVISSNPFVKAAQKKTAETFSGNGALKLVSTLDPLVDQFGQVGSYRKPRSFAEIEKDCELLWAEDQLNAVKFTFNALRQSFYRARFRQTGSPFHQQMSIREQSDQ